MCIVVLPCKLFLCKWYCITSLIISLFTQDLKNWFIILYTFYVYNIIFQLLYTLHYTIKGIVSIHHHTVDPLYPFCPPPTPHPLW